MFDTLVKYMYENLNGFGEIMAADGVRGREPSMRRKVYINLCVKIATAKIIHLEDWVDSSKDAEKPSFTSKVVPPYAF